MLERAIEIRGRAPVADSIRSRSQQQQTLDQIEREAYVDGFDHTLRKLLGEVAHKSGWFKQQGIFEGIARDIVGPGLAQASPSFQQHMTNLFGWAHEH